MSIADFLQAVPVRDALDAGHEDVEAGVNVLLYLPSRSTMNALCCGTTIAVLNSMTNATAATTSASRNVP